MLVPSALIPSHRGK